MELLLIEIIAEAAHEHHTAQLVKRIYLLLILGLFAWDDWDVNLLLGEYTAHYVALSGVHFDLLALVLNQKVSGELIFHESCAGVPRDDVLPKVDGAFGQDVGGRVLYFLLWDNQQHLDCPPGLLFQHFKVNHLLRLAIAQIMVIVFGGVNLFGEVVNFLLFVPGCMFEPSQESQAKQGE